MLPNRTYRLAVLTSHVIQYQTPLFRALAARPELDLEVLFCSDWGARPYWDSGFQQSVQWDTPGVLEGFDYSFLPNWSPWPNPSRFSGVVNPAVIRHLSSGCFDAVVLQGWSRLTNLLAFVAAQIRQIPILLRTETNLLPRLPKWKYRLKQTVLRAWFRRISGFLAIGTYNADFYREFGVQDEQIFMTPYAVDNEYFLSKAQNLRPKQSRLKEQLGVPPHRTVILFSGKLISEKNPRQLLEAFRDLPEKHRAVLLLLGDGPERSALEHLVEQQRIEGVHFLGFRNQTEIPPILAAADLLVLPSRFEPWGLVVNEAMCFGLPVIVSEQVGAGGDLVREGFNGFVYPVGDVGALIDRLSRIVSDRDLRGRMGRASAQMIRNWSYAEDIRGILACLTEVCGPG